mmetsp:Transcript_8044/g.19401  ORF Transcript_8044/g.19401 Transcript_8044/m.19401 type:complete len:560 (+) Transcript_8044:99-1778(+)
MRRRSASPKSRGSKNSDSNHECHVLAVPATEGGAPPASHITATSSVGSGNKFSATVITSKTHPLPVSWLKLKAWTSICSRNAVTHGSTSASSVSGTDTEQETDHTEESAAVLFHQHQVDENVMKPPLPPDLCSRVCLSMAPGKQLPRGGRDGCVYQRSLREDLTHLKDACKVNMVVCLLNQSELGSLGVKLVEYRKACEEVGIKFVDELQVVEMAPFPDLEKVRKLCARMAANLGAFGDDAAGNVLIHCRGGNGRAGTLAACFWLFLNAEKRKVLPKSRDVIDFVRLCRPGAIESRKQEDCVAKFREHLKTAGTAVLPHIVVDEDEKSRDVTASSPAEQFQSGLDAAADSNLVPPSIDEELVSRIRTTSIDFLPGWSAKAKQGMLAARPRNGSFVSSMSQQKFSSAWTRSTTAQLDRDHQRASASTSSCSAASNLTRSSSPDKKKRAGNSWPGAPATPANNAVRGTRRANYKAFTGRPTSTPSLGMALGLGELNAEKATRAPPTASTFTEQGVIAASFKTQEQRNENDPLQRAAGSSKGTSFLGGKKKSLPKFLQARPA